jgi:hypothetical protein
MTESPIHDPVNVGQGQGRDYLGNGRGHSQQARRVSVSPQAVPSEHECSASKRHGCASRKTAPPTRQWRWPDRMTSEHLPPSLIRKFQVDQQERFVRRARSYLRRQTLKDAPKLNDDGKGLGSFGSGSLDEQFNATLIEFVQRSQDC